MRGDLHHLFTTERDCNNERGNYRLDEQPGEPDDCRCGEVDEADRDFEPAGGKGPAARAVLYFLLRYPGQIGDHWSEYGPEHLESLLEWHREDPPGLYEKHRNQANFERQHNRNPLIDRPELAELIDFREGLGHH